MNRLTIRSLPLRQLNYGLQVYVYLVCRVQTRACYPWIAFYFPPPASKLAHAHIHTHTHCQLAITIAATIDANQKTPHKQLEKGRKKEISISIWHDLAWAKCLSMYVFGLCVRYTEHCILWLDSKCNWKLNVSQVFRCRLLLLLPLSLLLWVFFLCFAVAVPRLFLLFVIAVLAISMGLVLFYCMNREETLQRSRSYEKHHFPSFEPILTFSNGLIRIPVTYLEWKKKKKTITITKTNKQQKQRGKTIPYHHYRTHVIKRSESNDRFGIISLRRCNNDSIKCVAYALGFRVLCWYFQFEFLDSSQESRESCFFYQEGIFECLCTFLTTHSLSCSLALLHRVHILGYRFLTLFKLFTE